MASKKKITGMCTLAVALFVAAGAGADQGQPQRQERIDRAIQAGVSFLLSTISETGMVAPEHPPDSHLYGSRTAITTYALLAARSPAKGAKLRKALDWLLAAKLSDTYAVALRAAALAEWNDPRAAAALQRDAKWLIDAIGADGAYHPTAGGAPDGRTSDNLSTQFALLGLWAAAQRGVKVPDSFWRLAESHWLNTQHRDGGWNYRAGSRRGSYGSMTAAGLASLFIIFDEIHRADFAGPSSRLRYEPIAKAMEWLEKNFAADRNPAHSQWWHEWLFSVARVGTASGYKHFGGHNWYAEGADRLLALQADSGGWATARGPRQTALAILFLVRGRHSVLVNKLKYRGKWNARPRDMANLTRWLSWNFERTVSWQTVDIDSPVADWHDAPILYISGAGACEFTDQQIAKLRDFVLRGGLILSEAAANSGDFTLDMQKYYRRMFPDRPSERLAEDHPAYRIYFKPGSVRGLSMISNGIRPLVIHSPKELSLALQLGYDQTDAPNREVFELLANVYLYVTDKGALLPRGASYWPEARQFTPRGAVSVTPVKYDGNWNPEPMALQRLAVELGNRHAITLDIGQAVTITELSAETHPVAIMTGTESFTLTKGQAVALSRYFTAGGTLIIDAAGGSRSFAAAVTEQILPLPPGGEQGPVALTHPIFFQPNQAHRPIYRRRFAMALGPARRRPRLRAVQVAGRLAIIYSRDDITAGLVGYQLSGLVGYSPASAMALMTNIVCYAGGYQPGTDAPTTAPAPAATGATGAEQPD